MKLSVFLKQQRLTPNNRKSVYQAFIDNFNKDYKAKSLRADLRGAIADAFEWSTCPEGFMFWDMIDDKWLGIKPTENDMLWLLDGKEPPTEQPPILPIETNQLLDTEETKELDETVKATDPFGYYDEVIDKDSECDQTDGKRKQIGGNHYAKHTIQPWDIIREYELDFFEGNALKYLLRQKGNRLEDLQKAAHYIEECIKNEQKRKRDDKRTM